MGDYGTLVDEAAHKGRVKACLHRVEVSAVADPQGHLAVEGDRRFCGLVACLLVALVLFLACADVDEGASLALQKHVKAETLGVQSGFELQGKGR